MSTNIQRPVITYENVAVFQGDIPAHSEAANSGASLEFIPSVQSLSFSFDIQRSNRAKIGSRDFIDRSNRVSPNVNLSIDINEDFGQLFTNLLTGSSNIRNNFNVDRNFYAVIGDKRGVDMTGNSLTNVDMLSFGNCFLTDLSMSQSVNGLITSQYSFIASNVELQKSSSEGKFKVPSVDLTGDQSQNLSGFLDEMSTYYFTPIEDYMPYYSTNVLISGNGEFKNFLIKSNSIQNFDLNFPINRKTIYNLGKKYPVQRKVLLPSLGTFSFSNIVSDFEIDNFKEFLETDISYKLIISGQNTSLQPLHFEIDDAKFNSFSQQLSSENSIADFGFSFEINKFKAIDPIGTGLLKTQDNFFILQESLFNPDNILL